MAMVCMEETSEDMVQGMTIPAFSRVFFLLLPLNSLTSGQRDRTQQVVPLLHPLQHLPREVDL